MAKQKKCPECPPKGAPAYMSTYSDMVTLLLTFFILLLSFATMEQVKFDVAMTSLRGALGLLNSRQGSAVPISNLPNFQVGQGRADQQMEQMMQQVAQQLQASNLQDFMQVDQTKDRLHINIAEPMLFDSGSADIKAAADTLLKLVADILNIVSFEVRIEGHTDNVPMRSARYPSNWELSFGRGVALARKFMQFGVAPERFQVVGYGEYRPIADNDTREGRAINRRVDIYVNLRAEPRQALLPGE